MNMLDIIIKKRNGDTLTPEEIQYFITGYVDGDIPDYQVSALLMAIYFRGLDDEETVALTRAMERSGDEEDLRAIPGIKVDKHSTGGVGDKTTLIAAPIAAAAGVPVAKMSGRGLGFTGGTADKLEAIPGFRTTIPPEEFEAQVRDIGLAVITQTARVAPADKMLYALRDVTGTVENRSLIASSIMSKKLASGSDAILLDVKCGNGAFMKDEEAAAGLADLMIRIGTAAGRRMAAIVSDMNQPLGNAVGNALEVMEAIDVLHGEGSEDIREVSLLLAAGMILLGGKAESLEEAGTLAARMVESGAALQKFRDMVTQQGGDARIMEDFSLFEKPLVQREIKSPASGYIYRMDTERVGMASQHAGAGRLRKDDRIDFSAGIRFRRKVGDPVAAGEVVAVICGNDEGKVRGAEELLRTAIEVREDRPEVPGRILRVIGME